MRLNSGGGKNLHQFLTNNRANSQKSNSKNNKIYANPKIYNQSKSNINLINVENGNKRYNLFSNLNVKQKEKINLSKFLKGEKNYYNNINLVTEQNSDKKHEPNKLNLNLSFLSNKNGKGNSFKTLNYDRSSYVRIMKYFTIKSSNKPMEFEDLSPVLIPIRNTLSNEHRNNNLNINSDNVKDKINFYYYINSKEKVMQLFKDNKKKNRYKYPKGGEKENNNSNMGRGSDINNINLVPLDEKRNNNLKGSDNNLTFSKNSNESEFTFKDKGSVVFNIDKKSNNKDNSNDSSHNKLLNSELNSFHEKENKIMSNKQPLNKNSGKNGTNQDNNIDDINNVNNIKNLIKNTNEEKKENSNESPKFLKEKLFKKNNEKSSNLLGKILNNQINNKNIMVENDINSNNMNSMNTIDNNDNDNKNNLKNSNQFRIRKINLPLGLNLASIQYNNKLLQNLINKKSKKNKGVLNSNKIQIAQTEYKIMKEEKIVDGNKNIYNAKIKKKNDKNINKEN